LNIEFSGPENSRARRGIVVLAVGIASMLGILYWYAEIANSEESRKQQEVEAERRMSSESKGAKEKSAAEFERARDIASRLAFDWANLFAKLEGIDSENVALLGIDIDAQKLTIEINAQARDVPSMIAYVDAIARSEVFVNPKLQGHQVLRSDPDKPLLFIVQAGIAPAAARVAKQANSDPVATH
jgi:Tfp pilus assembly protein PilN